MTLEKLWAAIERYADEVAEYNTALRIDVGVDAASKNCLAAEKDLRALLAALSSSPEPSAAPGAGWQPIETAPEKTAVLVAAEFDRPGDWRIK